eukprot:maker-scaffold_34-snap-gene-3.14-mRNA-1 protein AED:0.28 eAED:0.28 QI:0/0.5/0.33/1/1/1/3/37/1084
MSFLVVHDNKASKKSLESLEESITSVSGFSTQFINAEDKKQAKKPVKTKPGTCLVLFVSKNTLTINDVTKLFSKFVQRVKRYCVIYEGDKEEGALYLKNDLQAVNIQKLFYRSNMNKIAKSIMRNNTFEVTPIMYRKNKIYSDFVVRKILHTLCVDAHVNKSFNLFDQGQNLISTNILKKLSEKEYNSSSDLEKFAVEKFNVVQVNNIETGVEFLKYSSKEANGKVALHEFNSIIQSSNLPEVCIENISSQIMRLFPKAQRNFVNVFEGKLEKAVLNGIIHPLKTINKSKLHIIFSVIKVNSMDELKVSLKRIMQYIATRVPQLGAQLKISLLLREDQTKDLSFTQSLECNHTEFPSPSNLSETSVEGIDFSPTLCDAISLFSICSSLVPCNVLESCLKIDTKEAIVALLQPLIDKEILVRYGTEDLCFGFLSFEKKQFVLQKLAEMSIETNSQLMSKKIINMLTTSEFNENPFVLQEVLLLQNPIGLPGALSQLNNLTFLLALGKNDPLGLIQGLYFLESRATDSKKYNISTLRSLIERVLSALLRDFRELPGQILTVKHLLNPTFTELVTACEAHKFPGGSTFVPMNALKEANSLGSKSEIILLSETSKTTSIGMLFPEVVAVVSFKNLLILGQGNGKISFYDLTSEEELSSIFDHNGKITSLEVVSLFDMDLLISTSLDGVCCLTDLSSGSFSILKKITAQDDFSKKKVFGFSRSVCINYLETLCIFSQNAVHCFKLVLKDGTVDAEEGKKHLFNGREVSCAVQIPRDFMGLHLGVGFESGDISLFNIEELSEKVFAEFHLRSVLVLSAFRLDGTDYLLSSGFDRKLAVWSLTSGNLIDSTDVSSGALTSLQIIQDRVFGCSNLSNSIVQFGFDGNVLKDISTHVVDEEATGIMCFQVSESAGSMARTVFTFGDNHVFKKSSIHFEEPKKSNGVELVHSDWITCIANNKALREYATGGLDGRIIIYDCDTGTAKRELLCEGYAGNFVLSRIGAWDASTGSRVPYLNIDKSLRNPLKENFQLTDLAGQSGDVEGLTEKDVGYTMDYNFGDQTLRKLVDHPDGGSYALCTLGAKLTHLKIVPS